MNILIVEDENTVAARLKRLTEQIVGTDLNKVTLFHTLDDADDFLSTHTIDLLFLDLNLAGKDGFDLLNSAVAGSFHTIVVSAYAERAIEAFEFGVLDFVSKPFTKDRLEKALNRFKGSARQKGTKYLAIKRRGIVECLSLDDVCYFQGSNIYSDVYMINGEQLLHDKPLNRLEQVLPEHFFRVHKSFIINENFITAFRQTGNNAEFEMKTGALIPISRSKIAQCKTQFV